jgi:hypothetical protein
MNYAIQKNKFCLNAPHAYLLITSSALSYKIERESVNNHLS